MSDSEEPSEESQTPRYGALGLLTKNPLIADPSETEQSESKLNDTTENTNGDDQKQITDAINEFQSESITPDDRNVHPRKSITSGRLVDNEESDSTPVILDSSAKDRPQGPIRSISESAIIDTGEHSSTLPVQQDETSTEDDDDDDDDSQQESTATQKKASDNEKGAQSRDELDREVANISRRPSKTESPLHRPRSPTPQDSQKAPTNVEPKRTQSSLSNNQKGEQNKTSKSASRQGSANKISQHNDNSSELSSDDFFQTSEQSKLIKSGEQLKIPINDTDKKPLNSPPPSPSPSTKKQMAVINPLLGKTQENSRPTSQTNRKNSTSSSISNTSQQRTTNTNQKPSSTSSRKGSTTSENVQKKKIDSRPSSTDADIQDRISNKRKSPLEKRSAQQSRKNSGSTTDQTVTIPIKTNSAKLSQQQNEKRLTTTDSDNEQINNSKLPRIHSSSRSTTPTNNNQTDAAWTKQTHIAPLQTTENGIHSPRPQSPNVEQIAERNQLSSNTKKRNQRKKKDLSRRSNSAESSNHIQLVDDKSIDSTSGNNTDAEHPKQRRVKSKKKDVETSTDLNNGNHQQQETTSQNSSKATKSMSNHSPSIRRRIPAVKQQDFTTPDTETDSNIQKIRRPIKKSKISNEDNLQTLKDQDQILKPSIDHERHTQSDTEQIISEKQKKRRRPKRISRTTQTYECVFRRMERDQHEELRPTNDTDKNVQTRRSCLRPRTRSPKRHYPFYLNTDAFKIEDITTKQFPSVQRNNTTKTSVVARSISPQNGKLLILRPTLPFHHTDAVNVQRISLQYAIDLIPNENKSSDSTSSNQRNKTNAIKQSEQTNTLPMIRSSSTTSNVQANKTNTKEKSTTSKIEDRTIQRKNGGTV